MYIYIHYIYICNIYIPIDTDSVLVQYPDNLYLMGKFYD